jgi:hypothetical protein
MAIQRYKISLNNARFPFVSSWRSRAALSSQLDTAQRTPRQFQGSDENIDFNVPQVIYAENVIPTTGGYRSVSYATKIPAYGTVSDFDVIFPLRDANENSVLFSPAKGKNYRYNPVTQTWSLQTSTLLYSVQGYVVAESSEHTPATATVTRAYVAGYTFVCYSRIGVRLTADPSGPATADGSLFYWNSLANDLAPLLNPFAAPLVQNLPIPFGEIDGIAGSNGYLIVWSGLTVYWAPFADTGFDFEAYANGEVTGAGYQIPEDVKGTITAIVPVSGGFIIFTKKNAVAAFYNASNFASPWIFRQVSNAGGLSSLQRSTDISNLGGVYAYTTGGLQKLSLNAAETNFPDATEFLGSRFIETFNLTSLEFDRSVATTEMYVRVAHCGQRYLVISYGFIPDEFMFALVYDEELRRWGKLKIRHRDCFEFNYLRGEAALTYGMLYGIAYSEMTGIAYEDTQVVEDGATYPLQSVAFMQRNGEVKLAVLDMRDRGDSSESVMVLGPQQLTRARHTTVHEVEIDGLRTGDCKILTSLNGRTFAASYDGYLREGTADYCSFGFELPTGKSHGVVISGSFDINGIVIHATNDGAI